MCIKFSAEVFVKMIVLGLFWEHGELVHYKSPRGRDCVRNGFTTVDHVLKVFIELGLITQDQVRILVRGRTSGKEHRARLQRHCGFVSGNCTVTNTQSLIVVRSTTVVAKNGISDIRLVTDAHIELTPIGKIAAPKFENEFVLYGVNKEVYCTKAVEINARFLSNGATAVTVTRYRQRTAVIQSREGED